MRESDFLSERWIQVSKKILDQLKHLEKAKKRDRLELVRSMHFVLKALEMSLLGWKQWVNNPDIMAKFTKEDLEKMNKKLCEFTKAFLEYDIEATKLGTRIGLKTMKKVKKKKETKTRTSYVA